MVSKALVIKQDAIPQPNNFIVSREEDQHCTLDKNA
jgi:hypothetical protein